MAGLVPATHVLGAASKPRVPGTRPGITLRSEAGCLGNATLPVGREVAGRDGHAAAHAFGREGQADLGLERAGEVLLDQVAAEAAPFRLLDRRPAALAPGDLDS